ncbi:unnamed protein product [Allacma fusca]|uniref:SIAH-type domain-containing protein n=1 Tax=Allacma fusca TaxID=39272 RepID=A0A8J2K2W8_9HEXA|nr:unnamed protein product [Allacma fusca]
MLKYESLREHEADCEFSPLNFCECLGISCNHKIGQNDIVNHLKTVHGVRGIETSSWNYELVVEIHQTIPKVELDSGKDFMGPPHFFLFDGTVFFLKTLVKVKEKCISWMVCVAGSQKTAEKYQAKIMYFTTAKKNCVEWKGEIGSFDQTFSEGLALSIPFKFLVLQTISWRKEVEMSEYSGKIRITVDIRGPATVSLHSENPATLLRSVVTFSKHVDRNMVNLISNINTTAIEPPPEQSNISEGAMEKNVLRKLYSTIDL